MLFGEPIAMALSRPKLPILDAEQCPIDRGVARGAYVLSEARGGKPAIILVGTGSKVHLAVAAQAELLKKGVLARVVSMPSWELFDRRSADYRARVLPADIPKPAMEAGITLGCATTWVTKETSSAWIVLALQHRAQLLWRNLASAARTWSCGLWNLLEEAANSPLHD